MKILRVTLVSVFLLAMPALASAANAKGSYPPESS